jgi:16S rRNA methyltransferase RsmB/F
MIAQVATVVRPGGRLIYSTCSGEPEENEDIVLAFLAGHPEFRRTRPALFDRRLELAALLDDEGALKTLLFRDGLEAVYAACLTKDRGATECAEHQSGVDPSHPAQTVGILPSWRFTESRRMSYFDPQKHESRR